ncbi:unnamed protein product [Anisakis simplex]|uniref:SHSP domain-containing protein n=1 Tax=Anisakis simplex TaxID=6269 RepID=A0A0M3J9U9_ANISI|nr:unnamed protein product [Anisakis simplex]
MDTAVNDRKRSRDEALNAMPNPPVKRSIIIEKFDNFLDKSKKYIAGRVPAKWHKQHPSNQKVDQTDAIDGVTMTKEEFTVVLDVSQYSKDDLEISVSDRYLIIKGDHSERADEQPNQQSCRVERHFVRKFLIPKVYDMDSTKSTLDENGLLKVRIVKKATQEPKFVYHVPLALPCDGVMETE